MILIISCFIAFIFGSLFGIFIGLFITGATEINRQHDYYQEGFIEGYNKGKDK